MFPIPVPPEGRSKRTCATTIVVRTANVRRTNSLMGFGSSPRPITLLFESDPMRALFDFSAFLRFKHLLRHPVEFFQHDRLAAHSSHEREDQRALLAFVERRADLSV